MVCGWIKAPGQNWTIRNVPVVLPNGSAGSMTLHVINGTADEIKTRPLQSVDAFFEIYAGL